MITRILSTVILAAVIAIAPAMAAHHEGSHSKDEKKAQTACPISGKDINKEVYVDHDGKRIYLCCPGCKEKVSADAEKIISKLEAEGVKLETVSKKQTQCPVMGGEINTSLYSDHNGKRVYFCCPMCKPKFEKEPAKYIEKMESAGIKLEKVNKGA